MLRIFDPEYVLSLEFNIHERWTSLVIHAKENDLIMKTSFENKIHKFVLELILCYFCTSKKKE